MVQFRPQSREIIVKVVYYGPPLGGKTTNLRSLYDGYPSSVRGELVVVPTGGDRTIFFDFLPIFAGELRGMQLRVQLYTVPGQVHYNSTRQVVLRGVDGVVFVADSQRELLRNNRESWENLKDNLLLQGLALGDIPHVLQYNKRDLPEIVDIGDLDHILNEYNAPFYEAISTQGIGVEETLQGIVKLVVRSLRDRFRVAIEPEEIKAAGAVLAPPPEPAKPEVARVFSFASPQTFEPPPAPQPPATAPAPRPDVSEVFSAPPDLGEPSIFPAPAVTPPAPAMSSPAASELPFEIGAGPSAPAPDRTSYDTQPFGDAGPPPAAPPPEAAVPDAAVAEITAVSVTVPPSPAAAPFEDVPSPAPRLEPVEAQAPFAVQTQEPAPLGAELHHAEGTVDVPGGVPTILEPGPFDAESTHKIRVAAMVTDEAREPLGDPFQFTAPQLAEAAPEFGVPLAAPGEVDDVFAIIPAPVVQPLPAEPEPVAEEGPSDRAAEAASLAVQRVIPRAIAQYGEVRELELEVPVPSVWVGGKRMTLQLRLTLVPQEE